MTQDIQQPQTIQQVIAQEFGFTDLDADRQERLIERMTESVIKRVLVDAYTKLSDSDRKQFEDLMENIENIDPNAIETFLREKLTDYDSIIAEAIADLKKHITETATT
ncbi:MAG: DUF5663 domain-containing protein [Parcubacteria group bacterium]|jgi:hypothetical protein